MKSKLSGYGLDVTVAVNGLDGVTKLRQIIPDLLILDSHLTRTSAVELLGKKREASDTAAIPVVMVTSHLDKRTAAEIAKLGVHRVLAKPVQMDELLAAITEELRISVNVDETPCIIDAHVNNDMIFVEVARGLNTEKIDLLKYKLSELCALYRIRVPKILVLMSSVEITPEDSLKLSVLFTTILEETGARRRDVKVLTRSDVITEFVSGRPEFAGIEALEDIADAIDGLLGSKASGYVDHRSHSVTDELLQAPSADLQTAETINIRFRDDNEPFDLSMLGDSVTIAIVDDDFVIREMVKTILSDTSFRILEYDNGKQFIEDPESTGADLVFLDLVMPEMDGFEVLAEQRRRGRSNPVIVMSALGERDTVVKVMEFGVRSYLIKPLKPEAILNKAREVLQSSF